MTINLEEIDYASRYSGFHKRWLDPNGLEQEYGFSKSWQSKSRMVSNICTIPYIKIGKFVRYDRFAIDKWIEEHQVQSI